jgi:hypothetical protein
MGKSPEEWGPAEHAEYQKYVNMIDEQQRLAQEDEEAFEDPEDIDWKELEQWSRPRD